MTSSRPNHELAISRAAHHLKKLQREVSDWANGDSYRLFHEFNAERGEYIVWAEADTPNTDPFSILAGDCLNSLTSGLNFLAYELSLVYTKPLPDDIADECEFPIFGDEDRKGQSNAGSRSIFDDAILKRIRGMDPKAQAIIKGLQPYALGSAFRTDPLWKLYELARINRHRFLPPAAAVFNGFGLDPSGTVNAAIGPGIIHSHAGVIEGRTEIARLPVKPVDPRQKVYVDIKLPIDVAFAQGTPAVDGESMVGTLAAIYNHIVTRVLQPLRSYLA